MAADKRELILSVKGKDDGASRVLKGVGDAADDTADDLKGMNKGLAALDGKIADTTKTLAGLRTEIGKTGDLDLIKDITKQEQRLKALSRHRKSLLGDDGDLNRQAVRWGAKIADGIGAGLSTAGGPITRALGNVFGALPPQAQAAIGAGVLAAAAAVAPLVGGVVAGAVVGGVGIGGVVGGLALAARHPEVKASAQLTGETFTKTMERAAVSFVPVTLTALSTVRSEIAVLGDDFERIFSKSSRFVAPLTAGFTGFIRELLPGVERAVEKAGPIIDELASWGPRLGRMLSDIFTDFADNAFNGTRALAAFWTVFEVGTRFIASQVNTLATVFGLFEKFSAILRNDIVKLAELDAAQTLAAQSGEGFSQGLLELVNGFAKVDSTAAAATAQVETFADMIKRVTGENLTARGAVRSMEEAIDAATAAFKENGKTLDENTAKGRANGAALDALAAETNRVYEATLAQTGSQDLASAAAARGRAKFIELATALYGSKTEAKKLADQLFGIPREVNTEANFHPDNKGVSNWKRTLSGIPREIFTSARLRAIVNVEVRREQATQATGRRWGGITEHAQSGLLREASVFTARSPARYAFAEPATGGEAFIPRRGDRGRALSILDKAAGWYGARLAPAGGGGSGVVNNYITLNVPPTANPVEVGRQVFEVLEKYKRSNGRRS